MEMIWDQIMDTIYNVNYLSIYMLDMTSAIKILFL